MKRLLLLAILTALFVGTHLSAAPNPSNPESFRVTATVAPQCIIQTDPAAECAFGAYDPSVGGNTCTAEIDILCTKGTTYWVALDDGVNPGATERQMVGTTNGDLLSYLLYQPDGSTLWGDNTTFGTEYSGTHDGVGGARSPWQTILVNGELPAGDWDVSVDSYVDTVQATVRW